MATRARLALAVAALAAVAALLAACSAGDRSPAWTFGPASATPSASVTAMPSAAPSAPPAEPSATPVPTTSPAAQDGITPEELSTLTGGTGTRIDAGPPTPVTRERAVEVVRERFPGDRPLIWDGLVTYGNDQRLGWMIVLGTAPGQSCPLHAGLLDRALEGGIVDATEGTIGWIYMCG